MSWLNSGDIPLLEMGDINQRTQARIAKALEKQVQILESFEREKEDREQKESRKRYNFNEIKLPSYMYITKEYPSIQWDKNLKLSEILSQSLSKDIPVIKKKGYLKKIIKKLCLK